MNVKRKLLIITRSRTLEVGQGGYLDYLPDIICDKCGKVLVEDVPDTAAICGECLSEEISAVSRVGSLSWLDDLGWRGTAGAFDEKPDEKPEYVPPQKVYEYWLVWHSMDGATWVERAFKDAPNALRAIRASRHRYTAWSEIYSLLAGARPEEALRNYIERYAHSGYETKNKGF